MDLYYVRHGKTQGNVEKNFIGRTESPLVEEGVQAAVALGRQIKEAGMQFDAIYSSSLTRQRVTAELIAREINYPIDHIIESDLLLERAGGNFEGSPQSEFFAASEAEQIAAGAESFADLAQRATDIVDEVKAKYHSGTVLFVGSAAIGEMMRAMIKYGDHTKMFDDGPLPNTELVKLI